MIYPKKLLNSSPKAIRWVSLYVWFNLFRWVDVYSTIIFHLLLFFFSSSFKPTMLLSDLMKSNFVIFQRIISSWYQSLDAHANDMHANGVNCPCCVCVCLCLWFACLYCYWKCKCNNTEKGEWGWCSTMKILSSALL